MELRDYYQVIARSWLMIAVALVAALAVAAGITALQTPQYRMTSQAFVSPNRATSVTDLTQGGTYTESVVKSYAQLATTAYVLTPVMRELNLHEPLDHLVQRINVTVSVDTVVLNIAVTDASRRRAAQIANAVSDRLAVAVTDLTPGAGGAGAAVRITRVQPATGPAGPVTPNLVLNLIIGLLGGLAIGLFASFVRGALDTRLRSTADVKAFIDVPILGQVIFDPDAKVNPLVVQRNAHGARAEAFRTLRTNLEFLHLDSAPRSLVVTSALEGEGKSTTAANLAIAMANVGKSVLLLDADLRRPKVADYMGLEASIGLSDVLIGRVGLDQALQAWGDAGLHVLVTGAMPPNPSEMIQSKAMADLLEALYEQFDTVIIDSPPLLPVSDASVLARRSSGALLVASAGRVKRPQLSAAVDALAKVDARLLGIVVTMVPRRGPDSSGYSYKYGAAASTERQAQSSQATATVETR